MSDLRSRAVVLGVTSGAAVLFAVPVVAMGQVPGVDQVVGGVNHAAQGVVQAAPAPPVRLPAASAAPAPRPAPAAQAPAPAAPPTAPAPATTVRAGTATASQGSGGSGSGTTIASASGKKSRHGSHVSALAASGKKASASQDSGGAGTDTQIADDPASAPQDASPSTLPFTGLQLALMGMLGMAAIAAGAVLRRGVRTRRA